MTTPANPDGNAVDDGVDEEIYTCLDLATPKSFFLYAGAGSGKTRSLVTVLDRLRVEQGRRLWLRGQRVGVITYTNAACDEIKQRLRFDALVEISTIHSFAWSLIGSYHGDIRKWLREHLVKEIAELRNAIARGRAGTKAALDRKSVIAAKQQRLVNIESIRRFVYSPTGDNRSRESLNHSEVIGIAADFLTGKPTLQAVLVNQYPILLIDESQDTNRHLMDAFLLIQATHRNHFCLGLFGDTMQRIYADGKVGLGEGLPPDWARPAKRMNHRSPARIITLINHIRSTVDDHQQTGRSDKLGGVVRLFVLPSGVSDRLAVEAGIADRMAASASDPLWARDRKDYKTLILEHHMAARRMGFGAMFEPLYAVERLKTGLLDGSLPAVRFFAKDVLPLVEAMRSGDRFAAAAVVRERSALLDSATLRSTKGEQLARVNQAKLATEALMRLWENGANPSFLDVLRSISASGLFGIPEVLRPIAARDESYVATDSSASQDEDVDAALKAWDQVMATPFSQIAAYDRYVTGEAPVGTHQGVKGLEFPRVMVIIDDEEARGFLFSYEKLFGAKDKSSADLKNESQGGETTIDRTRRLFYVTCSRAQSSLAIVAYSSSPEKVRAHAISEGWFGEDEVELVR